ncbi:heavy metal translocating P-type ATPase [Aquibacillus halophilus]|uniref:heavy metal translocating P-type ATPase n=1 Tax=Aquibacillus halophilus TaxID=930132 RepID=UPI00129B1C9B|nr:heavy metal translocating P-type ATPase [Aquibacillus halophilus]
MSTLIKLITNNETFINSNSNFHKQLLSIKQHGELIAAIFSGLIILTAWVLESSLDPRTWVFLNVLAFIIGGYAKAKEGILETISTKKLNVEMLMIFAAIGSAAIGFWAEGAILIFIFALSGALETYTMDKSEREISSLMNLQPEQATRIINHAEELVHVSELTVGDIVLIKAGERVPVDGVILKGSTSIDESAITGEAMPVNKEKDNEVFAGTINLNGSLTVEIIKPASESLFQKIISLVQNAQSEKSPSQLFIEKFENSYVNVVLVLVGLMMFVPHYLFGWSWTESIYRAMILLVVASPCALVASIMPATLSAISNGARQGILFKGGVHVENLSNTHAIAFDKTGTLTNGKPIVTDFIPSSIDEEDYLLSIISAIENESNHPLAQAIVNFCRERSSALSAHEVTDMQNYSGSGVQAKIDNKIWKIGKATFVGEVAAHQFNNGVAKKLADQSKTLVFIANEDEIVAVIALKDSIREDSKKAINLLKKSGIHTVMITGDNEATAKSIAAEAGVDQFIANCLPEDKVTHIKELRTKFGHVTMIGDGINDAPALATANVGIAMGAGTDVALETADIVLMKNDLSKIARAIHISKRMNKIVKQNVIFSISVIFLLILSNFLQVLDLPLGVIGHEGSTILVILNGIRLLKG